MVGMRPRAVGNPIENLCSVVGPAGDANLDSNRLPSLAVSAGVTSSGKPPGQTSEPTGVKIQQLYDDQDTVEHNHPNHALGNDFDPADIINQNPLMKTNPTRLPAIQNGGGSKTDVAGVKRSAASVTVPMNPETAMKLYMHKLAAFEHHEIFNYPKVISHLLVCLLLLLLPLFY